MHSFLLVFALLTPTGPATDWQLIQTPSAQSLNGISASSPTFAIAVGDSGQIVHFIDNDAGSMVPSGSTADLFDVFVAGPTQALASGQDVILQWDGATWTSLVQDNFAVTYAPVWHPPERDILFYGVLESNAVCPANFSTGRDGFCRVFGARALSFCGHSNDMKVVLANGDIWHIDNTLNNPLDPLATDPLFDQVDFLDLSAVFIPAGACMIGDTPPIQLFAINQGRDFWQFDGTAWSLMSDQVPPSQSLNWLSGTDPATLVAVGSETISTKGPAAGSGVVWMYDGTQWSQDLTIPANTPALADVDLRYEFSDNVFLNGFEGISVGKIVLSPAEKSRIKLAGDLGRILSNESRRPLRIADLTLSSTRTSDQIAVQITMSNNGPDMATAKYVVVVPLLGIVSTTCPNAMSEERVDATGTTTLRTYTGLVTLAPEQHIECAVISDSSIIIQDIYATDAHDPKPSNNGKVVGR